VKAFLKSLALSTLLTYPSPAQTPSVIPLSSEPHHHLLLHNRYVNVYHVEVAPHDAVLLHHHDFDAISIMLADAQVTVHAPGKPDAHQNLSAGQVRLQPLGYTHSTAIDGEQRYRNVTVELLLPQQGESNLCALVMAGRPLHCPAPRGTLQESGWIDQPQFETNRTRVSLVRLQPRQKIILSKPSGNLLVIAIDGAEVEAEDGRAQVTMLQAGDYIWLAAARSERIINNATVREVRLVTFNLNR
jgi:hypothetical protein